MDALIIIFAAAIMQNMVLSLGFGSSVLMRIVHRPHDLKWFGLLLGSFTLVTALIMYPLDHLLGTQPLIKLLRPLIIILITALLYLLCCIMMRHYFPERYADLQKLVPLAAFNNFVVGIALIANHRLPLDLLGTVGLAIGGSLGFLLLSLLTAEGMRRMENPDMPAAFRGTPGIMLYLGIVALALLGFSSTTISFL